MGRRVVVCATWLTLLLGSAHVGCAAREQSGARQATRASSEPATSAEIAAPQPKEKAVTAAVGLTGGGKGGRIIKVTQLGREGPGSLAEALAQTGPRIIVFEVGGIIDLDRQRLEVEEPYVTVAGQTAPSPGITLIRGGMRVSTHDVVLRHLRFRMGDAGAPARSGFEPDVATHGSDAHHILFDHVSVAWGVDENLSVSGPRLDGPKATSHQVTIRDSIIAEGLRHSVHEKGSHSMGTLVHDHCTDITIARNLYAHNDERNPWFKGFATGVVVNNLIYNPGRWAIRLGPVVKEWQAAGITPEAPRVSVVGNVLLHGPDTEAGLQMIGTNSSGSAYMEDNSAAKRDGSPADVVAPEVQRLSERVFWPEGLVARPASDVEEWVLARAGARPRDRDSVDARIIRSVRERRGGLIDSQAQVEGYPAGAATRRPLTAPTDGVDEWLEQFASELE